MRGWHLYVYIAFFLAIAILFQGLRFFLPMLPGPVNLFLIGSLVNMVLVLAVRLTQSGWAASIGVVLPFVALLQGHLPLAVLLPVVGAGNVLYALLAGWLWERPVLWGVPFCKAALLYGGTRLVIAGLCLTGPAAEAVSFMMSWPQIFTGVMGIVLAKALLHRLRPSSF